MNSQPVRYRRACRRPTRRRGAAIVEMSIVCPLLLLMAIATTDFGRVIAAYTIVSNAARAGAEYGALNGFTSYSQATWQSQLQQVVQYEMQAIPGYQSSSLRTTITTATDTSGISQVTVAVSYPFNTVVSWIGIPSVVTLNHSVEMRRRQ